MNTNPIGQNEDLGNGQSSEKKIPESTFPSYQETNITDGGEFLNDAIRTKDQPLGEKIEEEGNKFLKRPDYRHLF